MGHNLTFAFTSRGLSDLYFQRVICLACANGFDHKWHWKIRLPRMMLYIFMLSTLVSVQVRNSTIESIEAVWKFASWRWRSGANFQTASKSDRLLAPAFALDFIGNTPAGFLDQSDAAHPAGFPIMTIYLTILDFVGNAPNRPEHFR